MTLMFPPAFVQQLSLLDHRELCGQGDAAEAHTAAPSRA
jgi:hypothetical protein